MKENKEVFIEKFRIESSIKIKLEKKAKRNFLNLTQYIRQELSKIANK